jgi:hypothetical protein
MKADGGARDAKPVSSFRLNENWVNAGQINAQDYECGFCGNQIGTDRGFSTAGANPSLIAICPRCRRPTFIEEGTRRMYPSAPLGASVSNAPPDLDALYNEARNAAAANAYTAAVMVCRKMLMNIAVEKGAKERQTFEHYVGYLAEKHYIPPEGEALATYIRTLGGTANHRIALMDRDDAEAAIMFVGMLLRIIYELPALIPAKAKAPQAGPDPAPGNGADPKPPRSIS